MDAWYGKIGVRDGMGLVWYGILPGGFGQLGRYLCSFRSLFLKQRTTESTGIHTHSNWQWVFRCHKQLQTQLTSDLVG